MGTWSFPNGQFNSIPNAVGCLLLGRVCIWGNLHCRLRGASWKSSHCALEDWADPSIMWWWHPKMSKYMSHSLIENRKHRRDSAHFNQRPSKLSLPGCLHVSSWANSAFQYCLPGWLKQKTAGTLLVWLQPPQSLPLDTDDCMWLLNPNSRRRAFLQRRSPFFHLVAILVRVQFIKQPNSSRSATIWVQVLFQNDPNQYIKLMYSWLIIPEPHLPPRLQLLFACGPRAGSRGLRPGYHLGGESPVKVMEWLGWFGWYPMTSESSIELCQLHPFPSPIWLFRFEAAWRCPTSMLNCQTSPCPPWRWPDCPDVCHGEWPGAVGRCLRG